MTETDKRSDALGIAIQMERKGMAFYTEAADNAVHPLGRRMFASLAEDEVRHVRIFQEMAEREGIRPAAMDEIDKQDPIQHINTLFRETARQIKEEIKPGDDDIKVIDIAKAMEQKAFEFYSTMARDATDPGEKKILEYIAEEENNHWRILDDTKLYLTNPDEWHIKEEKPTVDGG